MLGSRGFEQLLPDVKTATRVGYLTVIEEAEFKDLFGQYNKTVIQKTPGGSSDIFFPEHGDEVRSQAVLPLIIHGQKIGCLNLGSILNIYLAKSWPFRKRFWIVTSSVRQFFKAACCLTKHSTRHLWK